MSTFEQFLQTKEAEAAWERGVELAKKLQEEGKGLEEEPRIRALLQAEADKHRKIDIWIQHMMAATWTNQALIRTLIS